MTKLSLRSRLIAGFGLMALALAAAVGASFWQMHAAEQGLSALYEGGIVLQRKAQQLKTMAAAIEKGALLAAFSGDKEELGRTRGRVRLFFLLTDEMRAELQALPPDERVGGELEALAAIESAFRENMEVTFTSLDKYVDARHGDAAMLTRVRLTSTIFVDQVDEFVAIGRAHVDRHVERIRAEIVRARGRLWWLLAFAAGLVIAGSVFLRRRMTLPLSRLADFIHRAGQDPVGMRERIAFAHRDEIQALGDGLGELLDRLQETTVSRDQLVQAKQAEAAARAVAEAASRSKTEFLANMSHELRTPMNGVLGMAQILVTTPLNEEQQGFVKVIQESGDALMHLLNQLLDFSRIEAGRLTVAASPFDLAETLQHAFQPFAVAARKKSLAISLALDPQLPGRVCGDAQRLQQVLQHLLDNAVKFTPQGQISVTAERVAGSASRLRIAVQDSGVGIDPETCERLFQPFTQGDGSATRRFGGTGLGLTIAQRLVALMGGEMAVTSEPGCGSTFSFELDCPPAETPDDANPASAAHPQVSADARADVNAAALVPPESAGTLVGAARHFDRDAMLKNLGCDDEIARVLLESLLGELPGNIETLAQAVDAGDLAQASREAHTVKGLAASGGALALRDLALQIEADCKSGDAVAAASHLDELRTGFAAAALAWGDYLKG